ncbi:MAG TPA: type II toxin-antitoxin system prevent-host-death family antitoxin [Aggregatilineales bacterium]|nr:type II toxin-antitoxin system prevent-host-death family antitoxin [Aggregatilineales bacterium]
MTVYTSYTQARENLAALLDRVTKDREIVIIERRGHEEVALIAADELSSLLETAYLLQSPANAKRLLAALGRALKYEGQSLTPDELRAEVGLDSEEA